MSYHTDEPFSLHVTELVDMILAVKKHILAVDETLSKHDFTHDEAFFFAKSETLLPATLITLFIFWTYDDFLIDLENLEHG